MKKLIILSVIAMLIAPSLASAHLDSGIDAEGFMDMHDMMGAGGMWMGIWMLIVAVSLIVWLIVGILAIIWLWKKIKTR